MKKASSVSGTHIKTRGRDLLIIFAHDAQLCFSNILQFQSQFLDELNNILALDKLV